MRIADARRLMLVTSHRRPEESGMDTDAYYRRHPFSVGAILYELQRRGWETTRADYFASRNPRALAARIDAFRPDVIYTYGAATALQPLWARRLFCRHRAFIVVHGWDDVYWEIWRSVFGRPAGWFMRGFERAIIQQSDAVVTLSRFNQARGLLWGVNSHYIPNGCDVPSFDPADAPLRLEGTFKLVYVGDQARWKQTGLVCEAMRRLPSGIKLYLVGRHYAYLERYASENCIFLGYLPSKEAVWNVMAQADVLVCTADQDCNAKYQEYLRMGKPILGYDERANLFFENGRNALLTRDYAAAILRLSRDAALRRRLVENARRDLPVASWAEIAERFEAVFAAVASSRLGRLAEGADVVDPGGVGAEHEQAVQP